MVRHTCLSPLVEVLGRFGINGLREKSCVKYWAISLLPVCTLIQEVILREFWSQKTFTGKFPGICW